MIAENNVNELLDFFKALSDANRLKIVGLLAQKSYSVEELSSMLELRPSTVSHHLSRLSAVGLVSARPESYYNVYQFESEALQSLAQRLLAKETLPSMVAGVDLEAYDRQVLANFTYPDGRLKAIPAQLKKVQVILRYVVRAFEPGLKYTEKEVNELLGRFYEDTAFLRRGLVETGALERERDGSLYWLAES